MGGEPASVCSPPRRPRPPRAHAPLPQFHARPPQLSGLADQHQPPARVRGVSPQLSRQPTLSQDRRDEDKSGTTSHEAHKGEAEGSSRLRSERKHPVHRKSNEPLLAAGRRGQQRPGSRRS